MSTFYGDARIAGDAVAGDKITYAAIAPPEPPRQLPLDTPGFTGRADPLSKLNALVEAQEQGSAPVIVTITGMPGIGKTALAVHWAHHIAHRFPDGHLFLDLRGYGERGALSAQEALGQALRALGVPPDRVPAEEDEMAALYRTQLANRRVLIVLDDAATSRQVRPLLPASPRSLVMVTARTDLAGLVLRGGARQLPLDVLSTGEALDLLSAVAGPGRTEAEPTAAAELVRLCGFLPLALSVAAANLAIRPRQTVADTVRALSEGDRLSSLTLGQDLGEAVRATFELSYRGLGDGAQRAFRLLGLVEGPTFTAEACGSLLAITPEAARQVLDTLAGANLIQMVTRDRGRLHELLREYARDRNREEDERLVRESALQRFATWYLTAAQETGRPLNHYRRTIRQELHLPPMNIDQTVRGEALEWFEQERPNLVALVKQVSAHGWDQLTWELADAIYDYLELRRYSFSNIEAHRLGLRAAKRRRDLSAQFFMHHHIAVCLVQLGRYDEALKECATSLTISQRIQDHYGEAAALDLSARIHHYQGRYRTALDPARAALRTRRRIWDRHGEAMTLDTTTRIHEGLSDYPEALRTAQAALVIHQEIYDPRGEAETRVNLARIHRAMGRDAHALTEARLALTIRREIGDKHGEGETLALIGSIYTWLGDHAKARENLEQALALRQRIGDRRGEAESLVYLSSIYRRITLYEEAMRAALEALDVFQDLGNKPDEADALDALARALRRLGAYDLALSAADQSRALNESIGDRHKVATALDTMARTHRLLGDFTAAVRAVRRALSIRREIGDRRGEGHGLDTLGQIYRAMGRFPEALATALQALDLETEVGDHYGQGATLKHLGRICAEMGRVDDAIDYLERALGIQNKIGDHSGAALTTELLSEILRFPKEQNTTIGDNSPTNRDDDPTAD